MRLMTIPIDVAGTQAALHSYLLDNTPEIDPHRVRPAVVIVPGGGYLETSDREAEPVAMKMLSFGYQAIVLRYTTPAPYPTALLQLAEAMRLVRDHASEWNIDPSAIMVMGFSAGGHLAADFCLEWKSEFLAEQGYTSAEIRPNGLALGYPVISSGKFAHNGSFENLLGPAANDSHARAHVSLEKRVNERNGRDFPPVYLFTTMTDPSVPVENSLMFVSALHGVGVEIEAHFFPSGRHGVSLATRESMYADGTGVEKCVAVWPELFHQWAVDRFENNRPLQ
jgi:acetyl esterase/lipase